MCVGVVFSFFSFVEFSVSPGSNTLKSDLKKYCYFFKWFSYSDSSHPVSNYMHIRRDGIVLQLTNAVFIYFSQFFSSQFHLESFYCDVLNFTDFLVKFNCS